MKHNGNCTIKGLNRLSKEDEELLCKSIKYDEYRHIISLPEIPSDYKDNEVGYIVYPFNDSQTTEAIDIIDYYKSYYGIDNIDDCNFAYSPGSFCNERYEYKKEFIIDRDTLVSAIYPMNRDLFMRIAIKIAIKYHYYVLLKYDNSCYVFDARDSECDLLEDEREFDWKEFIDYEED